MHSTRTTQTIFLMALAFATTFTATPATSGFFSPSWASTKKLIAIKFPEAKQLSTIDFAAWLGDEKQSEKPIIIDTRSEAEFAVSHLANAARATTVQEVQLVLKEKSRAKSTAIVVYCSVGYRSSELALQLQKSGYTRVQNLDGSIFQWANERRPVYKAGIGGDKENTIVTKVHPYNAYWGDLLEKQYWSHQP